MHSSDTAALVQRLAENPQDVDALGTAHAWGASDPQGYALFLEQVASASLHAEYASHWLVEAAKVWSTTLADRERAATLLDLAIEQQPANVRALAAARQLREAHHDVLGALSLLERERAVEPDPERVAALSREEVRLRRLAGDRAATTQALRRARELEPDAMDLLEELAASVVERALAGENVPAPERREAAEAYLALAETYEDHPAHGFAASALDADPTHEAALAVLLGAAGEPAVRATFPARLGAYLRARPTGALVAKARQALEDLAGAVATPDEAIAALEPLADAGDEEIEARLAALYEKAGRIEELATRIARGAAGLAPEARAERLLAAARTCRQHGLDTKAISLFRQVVAADPSRTEAVEIVAEDLRARRDPATLRDVLLSSARNPRTEAKVAREHLARVARLCEGELRDVEAATRLWLELLAAEPTDGTARERASALLEQARRWDELAKVLDEGAAREPDGASRVATLRKLAEVHETYRSDPAAAGDVYARIAESTDDAAAWTDAHRSFATASQWPSAARALARLGALERDPRARASLLAREADAWSRAGDETAALARLEQASLLDPANDGYAADVEARHAAAGRHADVVRFLLARAATVGDAARRVTLRKRAAMVQTKRLDDAAAAATTLRLVLEDAEDDEALAAVVDDAEARSAWAEAVALLDRRVKLAPKGSASDGLALRAAQLVATRLGDAAAGAARFEAYLAERDATCLAALEGLVALHGASGDGRALAGALERLFAATTRPDEHLAIADRLAHLFEGPLADPKRAARWLDVVHDIAPRDRAVSERLARALEAAGEHERLVGVWRELVEAESDVGTASSLTRRMAEVLEKKLRHADEALAALALVADRGDEPCREAFVALGDRLRRPLDVAARLAAWHAATSKGPARSAALSGAFERYLRAGALGEASAVAEMLGAADDFGRGVARTLEEASRKARDLDALAVAEALLERGLEGAARAVERVRQAEVRVGVGASAEDAIAHGEAGLVGLASAEAEPLVERLAALAPDAGAALDVVERHARRRAEPAERVAGLVRAARAATAKGEHARAGRAIADAVADAATEAELELLVDAATAADARGGSSARAELAAALATSGNDAGTPAASRALRLRRAALLAYRDLASPERAFDWMGDALVVRVEAAIAARIEPMQAAAERLERATVAIERALAALGEGAVRVDAPLAERATPSPAPAPTPPPARVADSRARSARPPIGFPRYDDARGGATPVAPPAAPVARRGASKPPPPPAAAAPGTSAADELLATLFEATHDLPLLPDADAGARFVLRLAAQKLRPVSAVAHLYDINRRELVAVFATGPAGASLLGTRTSESDPVVAEAMRRREAIVVGDLATDRRAANPRWRSIEPGPRSVLVASVQQGGRYLGMLELHDAADGRVFGPADRAALTYLAERLAEFVAARGLVFDADRPSQVEP